MERLRPDLVISIKENARTLGIVATGIGGIVLAVASSCGENKTDSAQSSISIDESISRSMDRSQAGPDVFVNGINPPHVGNGGILK